MKIKKQTVVTTSTPPARLRTLISEQNGLFTAAQANAVGISNEHLCLLVRSGAIGRESHGVYSVPGGTLDRMAVLQLRRSKAVFSHGTALFLHGLTDRDPCVYSVTVPSGYNTQALSSLGVEVFTIRRELHGLGQCRVKTVFGGEVIAYDPERTVCDCLRSRSRMDPADMMDAVKRYVALPRRNIPYLMRMAVALRVEKPLRARLEVLL